MATDIQTAISGQPVKNGTLISTCQWTGFYPAENSYVNNKPTITDIESKFDYRFDDIVFYSIAVTGTPASGCC